MTSLPWVQLGRDIEIHSGCGDAKLSDVLLWTNALEEHSDGPNQRPYQPRIFASPIAKVWMTVNQLVVGWMSFALPP